MRRNQRLPQITGFGRCAVLSAFLVTTSCAANHCQSTSTTKNLLLLFIVIITALMAMAIAWISNSCREKETGKYGSFGWFMLLLGGVSSTISLTALAALIVGIRTNYGFCELSRPLYYITVCFLPLISGIGYVLLVRRINRYMPL